MYRDNNVAANLLFSELDSLVRRFHIFLIVGTYSRQTYSYQLSH